MAIYKVYGCASILQWGQVEANSEEEEALKKALSNDWIIDTLDSDPNMLASPLWPKKWKVYS